MILFRGTWLEIFLYYVVAGVVALFVAFSLAAAGIKAIDKGDRPSTALTFFGQILLATMIFIILLRLLRKYIRLIIIFLEAIFLLYTSWLLFALLIGDPLGAVASVIITLARLMYPETMKNISAAIISGVVSGVLGSSLSPVVALLLYVILIVYDFMAVFVTGHMVELVRGFLEIRNALGGGDFVLPTIFSTSLLFLHPLLPILSFVASTLGLLFVITVHRELKRPLPALPYIGAIHITLSAFLSILLL